MLKTYKYKFKKSIQDAGWSQFTEFLAYKAKEAGRQLIKIDPKNTSQNCSGCNVKVPKDISVRTHCCDSCGLTLDRDHNAAINILRLGMSRQSIETEKYIRIMVDV